MKPGMVLFRSDASITIGSGHVMRCLTLAQTLRTRGVESAFLSRKHPGNLNDFVRTKGFRVHELPFDQSWTNDSYFQYASWLGASWSQDAEQTLEVISRYPCDILVVDHYALGAQWEKRLSGACRFLLAIDDLANRPHHCAALLDQNLGRQTKDYANLVPSGARMMVGPRFALLRPSFSQLRKQSLARRQSPALHQILISMGGVDLPDVTSQVIQCLDHSQLPKDCHINVVMGASAPWLDKVKAVAATSTLSVQIHVNISEMAELMCKADLAIGAAGSTAWERCCLGLPCLTLVLAENQQRISEALDVAGAAQNLGVAFEQEMLTRLRYSIDQLVQYPELLEKMSEKAQNVTDGLGAYRVADQLLETL